MASLLLLARHTTTQEGKEMNNATNPMIIDGHELPPGLEFMAARLRRCIGGLTRVEEFRAGEFAFESMEREPRHRVEILRIRNATADECRGVVGMTTTTAVADVRNVETGSVGWVTGSLYR